MRDIAVTPYRPDAGQGWESSPCARVITSEDELRAAYGDMTPAVDWKRHVLVAVHSGQRPTGGYWVRLESVSSEPRRVRIRFREGAPGPDDMVTLAFTHPAAFGLVSRKDLPAGRINVEFIQTGGQLLAVQEITISGR